jgi:hypothetical protein
MNTTAMSANFVPPRFVRGASLQFSTTFYDFNGCVTQPGNAWLYITFPTEAGLASSVELPMVEPISPAVAWTAVWDTRAIGEGAVQWFVRSDPGPPYSAEQGEIVLTANTANPADFPP